MVQFLHQIISSIKGVNHSVAEEYAHKSHHYCPYSKAMRGNIDVEISVK